jgi:hypothetical protein
MVRSYIKTWLVIGVLALAAAPVTAGNGHGRGRESVCDDSGLIGSAYAACHTYCESLDCDAADHRSSPRACERALARFLELSGGQQPPCVAVEPVTCPCALGWNDPTFVPPDWEPGSCVIYDSGEFGMFVNVVGPEFSTPFVQLSTGWSRYQGETWASANASCAWTGSDENLGAGGNFDLYDQRNDGSVIDLRRFEALFEGCAAELELFLGRYGMSLADCAVNP